MLSDVERSENAVKSLMERLQARFFKLHDTVRYRTAIPTAQVYVNATHYCLERVDRTLSQDAIISTACHHYFIIARYFFPKEFRKMLFRF